MSKIAVKNATGEVVGMATLDKDDGGPLTTLQATTNAEMPGHVVSRATPQKIDAFELLRRRVN
jgi:hypothetical protein